MYTLGITGSTGYIGSQITEKLSAIYSSNQILHLGRRKNGRKHFVPFNLETGLNNGTSIDVNTLIHLAAHVPSRQPEGEILTCEMANGRGTLQLLESIEMETLSKVIYTSSSHSHLAEPERRITNPYEGSKRSAELLLQTYAHYYDLHVLNMRLGYVYGPSMRHGRMIHLFMSRALADKPLRLFNHGRDLHYLIHVEDVVRAVERALLKAEFSATVDIVPSQPVSTAQIAETVIEVTGSRSAIEFVDSPPSPHYRHPETTRAREVLGFTPKVSLVEGLTTILENDFCSTL